MAEPDREKWNRKHAAADRARAAPAPVLAQHAYLLPSRGDALDLASGTGGNALLLARHGLEVAAWDISEVVLERLQAEAHSLGLLLRVEPRDITLHPPPPGSFDVIVVSRFLDRALCPHIAAALRRGGLLFYQTFAGEPIEGRGPANPLYRLERNELLRLFPGLEIILYREDWQAGDLSCGLRGEAMLIAQQA